MHTYIPINIGCVFLNQPIEMSFGELLDSMIENSKLSKRQFYEKLNIKKAYFYDIISGRTNPPPAEKQFAIIRILNPDEDTRNMFFEIAAKERNEFPADLKAFFDSKKTNNLRSSAEFLDFINTLENNS